MKYLFQFCIIGLFTFLGELLHALIPFPIPAAIWGLILLFLALLTGILRPGQLRETSDFLVALLPLLFVAPLVGIVNSLSLLKSGILPILAVLLLGTAVTFAVSGGTAQLLLSRKRKDRS